MYASAGSTVFEPVFKNDLPLYSEATRVLGVDEFVEGDLGVRAEPGEKREEGVLSGET